MARVIEQCSRWSGHAQKLSTHIARMADLLREADHWARQDKRETVTGSDVERAVDRARHRLSLLSERIGEEIGLETILIDTDGERIGAVNGISVFPFGNQLFGRPARITATASPGAGEVVDIEREAKLGGPLHTKGILILSGLVAGRYATDFPLSLSARVVFEQSYSELEGDSASSAELYALLSAISGVPLRQSFAVTGSVNQLGQVQPIGGVNEKIEGFFDICRRRGLTGRQGVVIPRGNVQHLMLRRDVIEAVRAGQFHIHAVSTIDEGLEVLTGVEAGLCEAGGGYPSATVNGLVQMRLGAWARTRLAYQLQLGGGENHE
jgi:predicted ATP-dependent protease